MVGIPDSIGNGTVLVLVVVASLVLSASTVGALAVTGVTDDLNLSATGNEPTYDPVLRLTSMCIVEDAETPYAVFRVRNGLATDRAVTYDLVGTNVAGGFDVPSGTERFFAVPLQSGPTTVRLFVDGSQVQVKASNAAPCTQSFDLVDGEEFADDGPIALI